MHGRWFFSNPVTYAYNEINDMVCGQHIYKSVQLTVMGEQGLQEKVPGNLHNYFALAILKDS